jgi:hypothetical protein
VSITDAGATADVLGQSAELGRGRARVRLEAPIGESECREGPKQREAPTGGRAAKT